MKEDFGTQVKHFPCGTADGSGAWTNQLVNERVFDMSMLEDGTYDVVVVDAEDAPDGVVAVEVAVSSGPRRGEVVRLTASNLGRTWFELLAAPATLVVTDGAPHLALD